MRDYEVVKVEQDVPNEFLLVFDDGDIKVDVAPPSASVRHRELRGRGAYYKNIERKMLLKKKRTEARFHHTLASCLFSQLHLKTANRAIPRCGPMPVSMPVAVRTEGSFRQKAPERRG